MRIGIHQPYLFPYQGYFDLIASVDKFVLYDDAKFMKGSFINRNNYPMPFTFRLKKHSDLAKINQVYFYDIEVDKQRFPRLTGLRSKYVSMLDDDNISLNCYRTLKAICQQLGIKTQFYLSSQMVHGTWVQGILDIVHYLGGDTYVNAPGGRNLYTQEMFEDIKLEFIDTAPGPSILCNL